MVNWLIQDNQIHTEGAKSLARALKSNVSLISVNLRYAREIYLFMVFDKFVWHYNGATMTPPLGLEG